MTKRWGKLVSRIIIWSYCGKWYLWNEITWFIAVFFQHASLGVCCNMGSGCPPVVKLIAKLLTNIAKLKYSQRINGSFFNFSFEQVFHGGEAGWGSGLKPWTLCSLVWWCRKIISKYFSVIVRKSYFSMVTTHNKKKILVSDKEF